MIGTQTCLNIVHMHHLKRGQRNLMCILTSCAITWTVSSATIKPKFEVLTDMIQYVL